MDVTPGGPTAAKRLNQLAPEAEWLTAAVGRWDVVMTFQPNAVGPQIVTTGLVAERTLIGNHLQEIMQPASGSAVPDFRRIAYLLYNTVEGRWQYVSMDTRFPVGIMPAVSFDRGSENSITLVFEPLGFVGLGTEVDGKMTRSNYVITRQDRDHDAAEQFWIVSDGSGRQWRAVRYEYTRRA